MQRLRTTFKRSRTPTGAEMKTQSSLEVPKQVRSASFDEIQLEAQRVQTAGPSAPDPALLRVPQFPGQRSRSVDSGAPTPEDSGNFLEVPKRFQRRRSSSSRGVYCVHCACLEEYLKLHAADEDPSPEPSDYHSFSISDTSSSEFENDLDDDDDDDQDVDADKPSTSKSESEEDPFNLPECCITVTLSPTVPVPPVQSPPPVPVPVQLQLQPQLELQLQLQTPSETESYFPILVDDTPSTPVRRKSIHRQEAFFAEPTGTSLENMSDGTSESAVSEGDARVVAAPGLVVRDIYLQVPDLKRDRAASVDSCFSKVSQGKTEELQHSGVSLEVPVGPNVALRSRSVDIVLPTDEQARYKALAMAAPSGAAGAYTKG